MNNNTSITSLMSTFVRAYHTKENPNPIYRDSLAAKLITSEEYAQIKSYIISGIDFFCPNQKSQFNSSDDALKYIVETQLAPTPLFRAKYTETTLETALYTCTKQYVILGAGMDTTAYNPNFKNIPIFEVDHPSTQADKIQRLKNANISIPSNVKYVPLDFQTDSLKTALLEQGFDTGKKTLFSLLGVSYYLTKAELYTLLENISNIAPDGSSIIFDFGDENLFNSKIKRVENMLLMAKAGGEPMVFSTSYLDLALLLEKHSFLIYELLNTEAIQSTYFSNRTDYLSAFEHISIVHAVLKKDLTDNTRNKIIQASLSLFSKYGFEGVSVRDISNKIGITQGALYKHFKNKEDIFNSIILEMDAKTKEYKSLFKDNSYQTLLNFNKFILSQFTYWTENEFASAFRRMLVLEQYKSNEISTLYNNYLGTNILGYIENTLKSLINTTKDTKLLALEYYSPIFTLINLYDTCDHKHTQKSMVIKHLDAFAQNYA